MSISVSDEKDLEELRKKRDQLFDRFLRNPTEIRLALEIKSIDDQVSEYVEEMKRARQSARRFPSKADGRTPDSSAG